MVRTGPSRAMGGTESVKTKQAGRQLADDGLPVDVVQGAQPSVTELGEQLDGLSGLSRPWGAAAVVAVALCLATSLVHVLLVFLYVAPPNQLSQYYGRQLNAWIFPLFEQNWRLFAPDPESVTWQISVRTERTSAGGDREVSDWFDLTAVDDSHVEHNVFPSHTTQNMLRRAWIAYLEAYGSDDQPHSERAVMLRTYLRNIAMERLAVHQNVTYEAVQLRVITTPIAAPTTPGGPRPTAPASVDTRYLPWWKVASNGN
ncbi:hypothetical protein P3T35_008073 [Kitasatospora sp. GP30]|nr:hypothetical protein [Kitasatospora sp. GP30]